MRTLFRCDASPTIGAGHVTRCRSLALALRALQIDSAFVTRAGWKVEGFDVLDAPAGPDDELLDDDLAKTVEAAEEGGFDAVIVDHYGASAAYLEALRGSGLRVGVIDDRADRDLRAAEWILNQNMSAAMLRYEARADTTLLLGPSFALLRPEFAAAHESLSRRFLPRDHRVLVTLGGGAKAALCGRLVRALERVRTRLEVRCVVADSADELDDAAQKSPHVVEVTGPVTDMTEHLLWADVSVNAGGSTCWEVLCLGVPMVVIALSNDQHANVAALADGDVAIAADAFDGVAAEVEQLLDDPARREALSAAGSALVDGRGAARAAAVIVQSRVSASS